LSPTGIAVAVARIPPPRAGHPKASSRRSAVSQGNAQTARDRDLVVGWGALPYFCEFSPNGKLLFDAEFPDGVNTYRAYQLPWPAQHGHGHR